MPVEGESSARFALKRRLERPGLRAAQPDEIVDAVRLRLVFERRKLGDLALRGGDDQLAATPMRHAVIPAEPVEHGVAVDAQPRLGEACRVIDAGMDDLAVARAHPRADRVFGLDDDDLAAGARERAGDRETDDARADDETIDVTSRLPPCASNGRTLSKRPCP